MSEKRFSLKDHLFNKEKNKATTPTGEFVIGHVGGLLIVFGLLLSRLKPSQ